MKVFIAGIAGFLGSHVAELFVSKGWEVSGIDNLTKYELNRTDFNVDKAREYNVNFLKSIGAELIVGDIRNYDKLIKSASMCDYIINCAAQPAMTIALEKPHYDAENNIMGTLNILHVSRIFKIPAAICSTIHVYGNGLNEILDKKSGQFSFPEYPDGIDEDWGEYLSGQITPLHVSKYTTELYARAFTESYGCKVFTARLTGIYGPRQFGGEDHGWVANFAIKTILGREIKVFGTDKQVRDILYVQDAARAFWDWYQHGQVSGVYNIGGGSECATSIRDCIKMIQAMTGYKSPETLEPARPGDLWYFVSDYGKAELVFGWEPGVLPAEGLGYLIDWIRQNEELFRR